MSSSPSQRFHATSVTVIGFLTLCGALLVLAAPNSANLGARHSKLAKLLDYDNYKKTFGKSYASQLEEATRKCYFYARAMDAFVSGVNYKYRNADYYKALNDMSDWTPEERARALNKHSLDKSGSLRFMPAAGEDPEETLHRFLVEHAHEDAIYRDLLRQLEQPDDQEPAQSRKKREASQALGPRDFSFDKLINSRTVSANDNSAMERAYVPSNNPNYAGIELVTRGFRDQIAETEPVDLEPTPGSLEKNLELFLAKLGDKKGGSKQQGRRDDSLEDEIFFDHRSSGCLSAIRHQRKCGCCYAFASTALAEWRYCKQTGQLVAFSEQYMVDCGKDVIDGLYGCSGGGSQSAFEFIANFGLELRSNYPYANGVEGTCPIDPETDLRETGHIRMDLDAFVRVPLRLWEKFIEHTPLYIMVDGHDSFLDYGGGVDDGSSCRRESELEEEQDKADCHAVVLVGHGREDGQEYWLIRNSYGPNWGDQGYYKLAKDQADTCVPYQTGWLFGTGKVRPRKNRQHY